MKSFLKYKCILWDFDGVLMDSMSVRDEGFKQVLSGYPIDQVLRLLQYHRNNGGLSRYVKFRYFFEKIRNETIDENRVIELAQDFSKIMMRILVNAELLINDSLDFVKENHQNTAMHIVSGSDGVELNEICKRLGIAGYFKSIHGSPVHKNNLVANVLNHYGYKNDEVVLIGDSINDYEAANSNKIDFIGYNNLALANKKFTYIRSFKHNEGM